VAKVVSYRFRIRRRTAASWQSLNEVLLNSEFGRETDTKRLKIGDGETPWNDLEYYRGGAHIITVGGDEVPVRQKLDFSASDFAIVDNSDDDAAELALSEEVIALLLLAGSASQPGHGHSSSAISDFASAVSAHTDVTANTAARHAAVTVVDSAEINLTLNGQEITAVLVANSIDESKLDASVNASLDLADSASQPGHTHAYLANVVEDTTPELGGNLDALRKTIGNVLNLIITGKATDYNAAGDFVPFIGLTASRTWDYQNVAAIPPFFPAGLQFPAVAEYSGTQTIKKSMFVLGGGFLFWSKPTIKNDPTVSGLTISGVAALVNQPIYQADTGAASAVGLFADVFGNPVFNRINSGTMSAGGATYRTISSGMTVDTGVSGFDARYGLFFADTGGGGSITNTAAVAVDNLVKATNNSDILLGTTTVPAGSHSVYQSHEKQNRWNGSQRWKIRTITGARTLDGTDHVIKYTGGSAANITLPAANTCPGREYKIKSLGAGVPTVVRAGGDTLDLVAANHALAAGEMYTITSDGGTDWVVG
jgi:hypothetical protein